MRCACGCGKALPWGSRRRYLPACAHRRKRERIRAYLHTKYHTDPAYRAWKIASAAALRRFRPGWNRFVKRTATKP